MTVLLLKIRGLVSDHRGNIVTRTTNNCDVPMEVMVAMHPLTFWLWIDR